MQQPSESDWAAGSIVWIETKADGSGAKTAEVIYELNDEPDVLRQMNMPEEALYRGARRGDPVFVQVSSRAIRPVKS